MSVVLSDAQQRLRRQHGIEIPLEDISELIYADDTLLLGKDAEMVEKYLACVVEVGLEAGLEVNWKKVELLNMKCSKRIARLDGHSIEPTLAWPIRTRPTDGPGRGIAIFFRIRSPTRLRFANP